MRHPMYDPARVDVRRIMCREGLQLECENQLLQLQEYSLKEAREHVEEREQIAKNYMLECERSNKYQHRCENLESENDALKAQLKLWKEKEITHIEHMSDLDLEKESWKLKYRTTRKHCEGLKTHLKKVQKELDELKEEADEPCFEYLLDLKSQKVIGGSSPYTSSYALLPAINSTDSNVITQKPSVPSVARLPSAVSALRRHSNTTTGLSKERDVSDALQPTPPKDPRPSGSKLRRRSTLTTGPSSVHSQSSSRLPKRSEESIVDAALRPIPPKDPRQSSGTKLRRRSAITTGPSSVHSQSSLNLPKLSKESIVDAALLRPIPPKDPRPTSGIELRRRSAITTGPSSVHSQSSLNLPKRSKESIVDAALRPTPPKDPQQSSETKLRRRSVITTEPTTVRKEEGDVEYPLRPTPSTEGPQHSRTLMRRRSRIAAGSPAPAHLQSTSNLSD